MKMKSAVSFLSSSGNYLLYADCIGSISVWDISKMVSISSNVSIAPLLDQSVTSVYLKDDIIMAKANGKEYAFNKEMHAWSMLSTPLAGGFSRLPKMEEIEVQFYTWYDLINFGSCNWHPLLK